MDMVLYALIKGKIENMPQDEVKIGDYKIFFVNEIPSTRESNAIYFVIGNGQENDQIFIGKQGISNIIVGDHMVDYGVLNGSVFLDRYDFLRGLTRVIFTSLNSGVDGYLECSVTVDGEKIDSLLISGNTKGESNIKSIDYYGYSISTSQEEHTIIEVNQVVHMLPDGSEDVYNVLTGELIESTVADVIDSRITWTNVGLYGDYREFRMSSYSGFIKPAYLTYSGGFNSSEIEVFTSSNAYANNGFEVLGASDSKANKACIYVSNGLVMVRVLNSELSDTSSSGLAKSMQAYIAEHPINIVMKRKTPRTTKVSEPIELYTFDNITQIEVSYEGDAPIITAKVPIKKED